jgi:hypothetical protein
MHRMHKHAARLRVSFCLPDQGMQSFEILSRATAFAVRRKDSSAAVFTSGHVASPWLFPRYHESDMEWLQHVSHRDCAYSLIVDGKDGEWGYPLGRLYQHPHRDVAMLTLKNEAAAFQHMVARGAEFVPLKFRESLLEIDENCSIAGYEIEDLDATSADEESADERVQIPFSATGRCSLRIGMQSFIKTSELLNFGMCGAPVIDDNNECAGLIEGIVPSGSPMDMLVGHAGFIDALELVDYMHGPSECIELSDMP